MNIGVESVLRDRDILDCVRGEGVHQRGLHLRDAEDARAGAGHGHPHAGAGAGDKHADDRVAPVKKLSAAI